MDYFKKVALSVYPLSYHEFSEKPFASVIRYFFATVLLGLVICNVLLLPFYLSIPTLIEQSFGKFTTFDVETEVEMSGPVEIPKQDALFVIDTTGTIKEIKQERFIVTKDYLYYRLFFNNKRINFDNLFDIVGHPRDSAWMVTGIIAFLLPSLLIYAFLFITLKYFVIIFLSSFLLYFIVRVLMLYEILFKNALNCAFYAGTLLILVEAILYPINNALLIPVFSFAGMHFYVVSYIIFIVFGVMGMVIVEKDIHIGKKPKKKQEEKKED